MTHTNKDERRITRNQIKMLVASICKHHNFKKDLGESLTLEVELSEEIEDVLINIYGYTRDFDYIDIETGKISLGIDDIRYYVYGEAYFGQGEVSVTAIMSRLDNLEYRFKIANKRSRTLSDSK